MKEALGLIEVKGLVASIEIADTMAKVAAVNLEKTVKANGYGWTTICISGDVAAVSAAIQAGKAISEQNNWLVSFKVIPRPAEGIDGLFKQNQSPSKGTDNEKIEKQEMNTDVIETNVSSEESIPVVVEPVVKKQAANQVKRNTNQVKSPNK